MKVLMRCGREVHDVIDDGSDDVTLIWPTGLIHRWVGMTKPDPKEIRPGFTFDWYSCRDHQGDFDSIEAEHLVTNPIAIPKSEVCDIFGLTMEELRNLRDGWGEVR